MYKFILFFILVTISFSSNFMNRLPILEITAGKNEPTGSYEKYADPGLSFRLAYSFQFRNNEYFRPQFAFQYIHFKADNSTTNFTLDNGLEGPSIDLTRRESALLFNAGLRYSFNDGIFNDGYFRPYLGGYVGLANFKDATYFDWSDNDCSNTNFLGLIIDILLNEEISCLGDDNGNQSTTVHDKMTKVFYSLEFGSNIHFPKTDKHGFGLDIGIRYNIIPGLRRSETIFEDSNSSISSISKKLDANYYTLYMGTFLILGRNNHNSGTKRVNPDYTF